MSPLTTMLLRRLAIAGLLLAIAVGLGPRLLRRAGWIGPSVEERIEEAQRALAAAHQYGAGPGLPAYVAAESALERASARAGAGRLGAARREARDALQQALDAQRLALAQFEDERRAAQKVVRQIDDRLDEVEELFARLPRDMDQAAAAEMSSLLKATRRAGAGLWLAFEEQRFDDVLRERDRVLAVLDANRETLRDVVVAGES